MRAQIWSGVTVEQSAGQLILHTCRGNRVNRSITATIVVIYGDISSFIWSRGRPPPRRPPKVGGRFRQRSTDQRTRDDGVSFVGSRRAGRGSINFRLIVGAAGSWRFDIKPEKRRVTKGPRFFTRRKFPDRNCSGLTAEGSS